jgi:hypothetical protein
MSYLCRHVSQIYITTLIKMSENGNTIFNERLQLDKSKYDQTVDKQYMKSNIKCIKFQGHQYTQDSECYCLWDRLPCWVYIERRWILETHPSIKQYIIAHVKTLVFGRYTPTVGSIWPCALLIVIVKLRRTGNYFLLNLKGSERSSDGHNRILGMKTMSPACVP